MPLAISINLVLFGLMAPFSAALMERFGLWRVVAVALTAVAVGSAATAAMSALWQLNLLWGVVIGAATGCLSSPLAAIVATRWFVERRGLVTGALSAAHANGQLIVLPFLAVIARDAGWRWAAGAVALTAALTVPLAVALLAGGHVLHLRRDHRGDHRDPPDPGRARLSLFFPPFVLGASDAGLVAFVVVFGLDWVATVPPTVALTVEAFGREHASVVFGWIFAAQKFGAAAAAWAGGAMRAAAESYEIAFLAAGLLGVTAAFLALGSRAAADPRPRPRCRCESC